MIDKHIKGWVLKAESDLKIVKHELKLDENEIVKDISCYHCQQAVEKFLKAFLLFHKIEFPRTHNLEYLLELCIEIDKDFKNIDVEGLTDYAVNIRYPDMEYYEPEIKDIKNYYQIADRIREMIFSKLKIRKSDIKQHQ